MMAISVDFGINTDDERVITKTIDWIKTNVSCDIFNPTDRLDPILMIKNEGTTTNTLFNIKECNYMNIEAFGRKYFITQIEGDAAKVLYVYGHVDVLGTYDEAIRACECTAARSTSHYNYYLQDNSRLFNTYVWNQYKHIGSVGAPDTIILITV